MTQISLDSYLPETHDLLRGKRGVFGLVTNATKVSEEVGLYVVIRYTANDMKYGQVRNAYLLCDSRNVDVFMVKPMKPSGVISYLQLVLNDPAMVSSRTHWHKARTLGYSGTRSLTKIGETDSISVPLMRLRTNQLIRGNGHY